MANNFHAGISEKLLKNWSGKGRDELLALFVKTVDSTPSSDLESNLHFKCLVNELLGYAVSGNLECDEVASFLTELAQTCDSKESFPSVLADLLSVLDAEVSCSDSKEQRVAFKSLALACMELVGESLLKERLDMDTLEVLGLVHSKTIFNQKYVKTKTKLYYKQQKFNLFREESEGYSKLIAELGHERRPEMTPVSMLDNIKSLIGRFNLDPNRVLGVTLEAFKSYPNMKDFFLRLLEHYPCEPNTFVNILGFNFHSYQHADVMRCPPTPSSLYNMAAQLLHRRLVKLKDIYPHLGPADSKMEEFYKSVMEDAKSKEKKVTVVSLMTSAEKTDEEAEKEAESQKEKELYREKILCLEANQKLGVCHSLLGIGDLDLAFAIMDMLPPYLVVWSPPVSRLLCSLVHSAIEPLYHSRCEPRAAKRSTATTMQSSAEGGGILSCSRFEDLLKQAFKILFRLGPYAYTDPTLIAKLLRVGKAFFKEHLNSSSNGELPSQDREDVFSNFISVLDEVVLPSLSLMHCNVGMAEEVWGMVKHLSYEVRYQLFGHWKNSSYDLHPEMMQVRASTVARGKYIMKRLTKDNVKPSGRQIGKLTHSSPGIIFDYVLSQIQRFDNFIIPVVDSIKYLTPLAYDMLAYCIIEALGNPQKERLKHEDTNISTWLQGLAIFSANVFKKYPIELTGLLQYVANQLKAGKSFDLLVLKEVVQKMSGIEISEEMTNSQLEALGGGELLKAEGGYFAQVRNTKKSSQRLREALVDTNLSLPLCLLMAQQRDCIIFREGNSRHLKLVCNLYDHCMDILVQFGGFLSAHMSHEEYSRWVPALTVLVQEFHIPADVAFFMLRPIISNAISVRFSELDKSNKSDSKHESKSEKKAKVAQQEVHYVSAFKEVLKMYVESVKHLHPPKVWEEINPNFYMMFWSLSLYDLYVPTGRYDEEIAKANQANQALESDMELNSSKRKKEQERNLALIGKLQEERQRQEDNNRLVLKVLREEKDTWCSAKVTKNRTITHFLQLCVFPRCCFSAADAIYCAKFVHMMHSLHTPNFSTLLFFDRVFSDISYTVACCTENEVRRYGRFLGALLEVVSRWHAKESVYQQECSNTPGFISMMRSSSSEKQYLDYENFRHITFKWHFKLTKSLVVCLESKDYLQIRNSLIVLTKILPHYPKVYHLSIALEKRVEKLMEEEKEKRPDLYVLATGYAGMLKAHKHNLVNEADFHNREERVKAQQSDADTKLPVSVRSHESLESRSISKSKSKSADSTPQRDDGGKTSSKNSDRENSKKRKAEDASKNSDSGDHESTKEKSSKAERKRDRSSEDTSSEGNAKKRKDSPESVSTAGESEPKSSEPKNSESKSSESKNSESKNSEPKSETKEKEKKLHGVKVNKKDVTKTPPIPVASSSSSTKPPPSHKDKDKDKTSDNSGEAASKGGSSVNKPERKRDRSAEKELLETAKDPKRRKESPISSPAMEKRVLKVNKKEPKQPSPLPSKATGTKKDEAKKRTSTGTKGRTVK